MTAFSRMALVVLAVLAISMLLGGQEASITPPGGAAAMTTDNSNSQGTNAAAAASASPATITLEDALRLAQKDSTQFQAAVTDAGLAHQDRVQARAGLLPSVSYNAQYLYSEGNGTAARFIANNGVHEYISEGNAHQVFDLAHIADFQRSGAAEALAKAKAEIAARGLVVTVTQSYYALIVGQRKYANGQQAASEALRFRDISQALENGGEVAHSDVIKAQLQLNDRQRDLHEAELAMNRARLELAILLFPNLNQNFAVVDDLRLPEPLPAQEEIEKLAAKNNPEVRAAMSALEAANHEVNVARSGHLPSLALDYWYGIDANHFAVRTNGFKNLGYSAAATLSLPIWSWGATQSKVKQAELRRNQSRLELSAAQRTALADLREFYDEAQTARAELEGLRNSAELAAESARLITLRYQAGESTVLEVVDAQNTLTLARNAYDDGEARYRVAVANLQTLTGRF
ncbi:MAG TPA: TolC family protein [Terriglobales bacterium]|nr:TolC family protein [Terriglobales bacterium]